MYAIWVFLIVVLFIGVTYAFGAVYYIVCEQNRKYILQTGGWNWFCLNGVIGVPFHEISHLVFALVFGHSVTEVRLFRPFRGKQDGVLGYVRHSYNPRSLWQTFGNFFIGVAPMLFGSGVLLAILLLAFPEMFDIQTTFTSELSNWVNIRESVERMLLLFRLENLFSLSMLLLMTVAIFICPHLGMSGADFKGALAGTLSLLAAALVIPFWLTAYRDWLTWEQIVAGLTVFMIYYLYAMVTGLMISIFVAMFNFALSRLFGKTK
jgi:hypothetical protein